MASKRTSERQKNRCEIQNQNRSQTKKQSSSKYYVRNLQPSTSSEIHIKDYGNKDNVENNKIVLKNDLKKKYFGYKRLEELSEKDPSEIVFIIFSSNGFLDLFNLNKEPDWLFLIIKVVAKICATEYEQSKLAILKETINVIFISHLKTYILVAPTENNQKRIKNMNDFFNNCLLVFESITNFFPKTAVERLQDVVISSSIALMGIKMYRHEIFMNDLIVDKMNKLLEKIKDIILTKEVKKEEKLVLDNIVQLSTPPENFRELSVFPTVADIDGEGPFLRPNVINGSYHSIEHYLDVQFRLLREDFVAPLREGIQFYKKSLKGSTLDKKQKRINNIRIYHNVQFEDKGKFVQDKYGFVLNFNKKKKIRVNWDISKRFMFGSLLLFSSDNFISFFIGIVLDRKIDQLKEGILIVELLQDIRPAYFSNYTMIESEVFFEPYKCTMEALKNMYSDNFPMEKYIIFAEKIVNYPSYINSLPVSSYCVDSLQPFDVLNDNSWPSKHELKLDEMQYEAFKAALQNELVIIQGPPGTGKTFIGLKIMKTLIENLYIANNLTKPILVVCFTNHALDQFMEGIIQFTQQVVRIGGQSKSELVQHYSLINITRKYRRTVNVSRSLREINDTLKFTMREINYFRVCSEEISNNGGILDLTLLKNGIPLKYHNFFITPLDLLSWLFQDFTYFNSDPIVYLKEISQNSSSSVPNKQKIMNINILNEEDIDDTMQYKTDDPDLMASMLDNEHIAIYCLTLKKLLEDYQNFQLDFKELQLTAERNYTYYNKVEEAQINLREIENIIGYFRDMLKLVYLNQKVSKITNDLNSLNIGDRWLMYFSWVKEIKFKFSNKIMLLEKYYKTLYKQYVELKEIENIEMLNKMHVVAMTTTGAAKHRVLLEGLQSPIVVIEEAAEVLEAHIISSLTRYCEHLILIGDHKQLRPSNAVYKLAKDYKLDISLFERMINNDVPCYALGEQHRMRPEISSLITPTIYATLKNHISVYDREHILGVTKDLFFINHNNFEKEVEEISSKSNDHEAKFLIMFARHLILQGYNSSQVTILTTYSGQMFQLRTLRKMHPILKGLKIIVVDNYQGEENDIILLSMVRSNEMGNVGFLKIENRICVALSRAKSGLYIIGNMNNLYDSGELWKSIKAILIEQDSYGDELTLECAIHKGVYTKVSNCDDFNSIIEGGCSNLCRSLLTCGHYCTSICHPYNREHLDFKCRESCNRSCNFNHLCKKQCFVDCGDCSELVLKELPCEHTVILQCSIDSSNYQCQEEVLVKLDVCGHEIKKKCFEVDPKCTIKCYDRLDCGHSCILNCHKNDDPNHEKYLCLKRCEKINKNCESIHKCNKRCYEECASCVVKIDKNLPCGHIRQNIPCGLSVDKIKCFLPCTRMLSCGHKCKLKCSNKCGLCKFLVSKIISDCGHKVTLECRIKAERKYCNEVCNRKLPCGHMCKGRCAEDCDSQNCKEIVFVGFKNLSCGHNKLWMLCCDRNKDFSADSEYLLDKCQEKCSEKLICGDICSGTCGKCKQGRLHVPCEQKCNKVNVCNHTCNFPCKMQCPPCNQNCSFACIHSKCTRKCGMPCVPCQENCEWKCEHLKCTKKCGDICNRHPCYIGCKVLLKCGHKCIGFCGEPCPPFCRVCHKEEITTIVFGNEDEPDARFVYLEDCQHSIESNALEQWLNQQDEEISMKLCPLCKTPILKTQRFMNKIKLIYLDISKIKKKSFGNSGLNYFQKNESLITSLETIDRKFDSMIVGNANDYVDIKKKWNIIISSIFKNNSKYKTKGPMSLKVIESLDFTLNVFKSISNYKERVIKIKDNSYKKNIIDYFVWLLNVCFSYAKRLSNQQKLDINLEMVRALRVVMLYEVLDNTNYRACIGLQSTLSIEVQKIMDDIKIIILTSHRYSNERDKTVQALLNTIEEKLKGVSIITEEEKKMIHQVMSRTFYGGTKAQGHWMKCKNGHIYCIGECGGAMEKSICPECKVEIGGTNHTYVEGTTVATEIDGARHLAWSAGNNMANYGNIF
ncbi:NFX1-type zinc finger-containing protein 1-like [Daktulosphaira vitifoliae]|uniref:NFX1-type zinc finger-containing protein 1-like n=1 Tax=Daktulosphaira vitifoliae TaxID=58002 RepID=UPI0021A9C3EF|nr:NFX1-type zinc finger-containing protein 1-like [Daktulosphaira vitifoliae]XP_050539017.1 NFX1-type zinc finger-containing protein 1-like [Daktulosphaira vitifoliae]